MSTDLIARLEAANEGSRELDRLIHNHRYADVTTISAEEIVEDDRLWSFISDYTRSLDAALKLVPEHLVLRISTRHEGDLGAHAILFGPSSPIASDVKVWGQAFIDAKSTRKANKLLALALCIAALKARVAS